MQRSETSDFSLISVGKDLVLTITTLVLFSFKLVSFSSSVKRKQVDALMCVDLNTD